MSIVANNRGNVIKKAGIHDWFSSSYKAVVRDRQLYLILIPFLLYFAVFVYKPMPGLIIAFKDYNVYEGILESPWVGLKHFIDFFEGPYFFRLLRNTFLIGFYSLAVGFPSSIILALLLNEVTQKRFKGIVQTITYLPHFVSAVVVAGMVTSFLAPSNGIINILIEKLGGEKIYFLSKPEYFRTIYTSMGVWTNVGYGSIVYLSALSGIDMQLYEAAKIDGAGKWRQLLHVTLPGLLPTIVTMFIIRIGGILNVSYETIILLYQPATYETADVFNSYVYRLGIEDSNYSLSAAVSLFNSVIGFILVVLANKLSRKVNDVGLW